MITTTLQLLLGFIVFIVVQAGRVRPYGARYVTMSNVNPSGWSEYNFTMTFDTLLPANGFVQITFPSSDYPSLLGLGTNFLIYAPYPKIAPTIILDRSLQVSVGLWPSQTPLTITVVGVKNSPKLGGTGNFAITTQMGYYIIDSNSNFAVVGLAQATQQLLSASIMIETGQSQYAGDLTNYLFFFVPSDDLPVGIDIKLQFPLLYNLTYLEGNQWSTTEWKCDVRVQQSFYEYSVSDDFLNVLYFQGNAGIISKGTQVVLRLRGVTNPLQAMQTPLFSYQILEAGTNNTLQESDAVLGLNILAGQMQLVQMFTLYPFSLPYAGYLRSFVLQFRPHNPFIAARIMTEFFQIISCQITAGLLDISEDNDSVCTPSARLMYLTNFAMYQQTNFDTDYIEVRFQARINYAVLQTNPVQIYTYSDAQYLQLVDEDILSISTQVNVLMTPTISSSVLTPGQPTILTFTLNVGASYTFGNLIEVELDKLYTGIPLCVYQAFGTPSFIQYNCSLSSGMLTFNMANQDTIQASTCTTNCPILRISGLNNPVYGGSYGIRLLLFGNGASLASAEFNATFLIPIPGFTTTTVGPISNNANDLTAFNVNLLIYDNLPAGVKNQPDPFVSYSYIDVWFKQVTAGTMLFARDLGTGVVNLGNAGCVFESGLLPAQSQSLSCIIKYGALVPGVNDWTIVRIKNYAALISGVSGTHVLFDIPIQYPSSVGITPQMMLVLTRFDNKIPTIIRQQSYFFVSAKNVAGSPLPAANLVGPTLDSKSIQTDATITYQIKNVFNVPALGVNSIYYQIPPGFTFNFTKVQVSIDNVYLVSSQVQYFPVFNIIILRLLAAVPTNFPNGQMHKITFEKVDLPISLNPLPITHYIKTATNGQFADQASFTMPTLTGGTLFDIQGGVTPNMQGHFFANYSIAFTTTLQSYAGASITIDFPAPYNFGLTVLPNGPRLDNIPYCGLYNVSSSITIAYSFIGQRATISQFQGLVKGQRIQLALFSVTNPVQATYVLQIAVRSANGNVVEQGSISMVIGSTTFVPFAFNVSSVASLPNNAGSEALYFFRFTPPQNIPLGSVIQIQFPASFAQLYTVGQFNVYCLANVGPTQQYVGLASCSVNGVANQVLIQTNAHFYANVAVELQYYGMLIQNTMGMVSNISINVSYAGMHTYIQYVGNLIASSQMVANATITSQLVTNQMATLDYYPRNEGEIAYYVFGLPFIAPFDILSSFTILIKFPFEYDFIVGLEKMEITSTALQGALTYRILPRHVFITGFYNLLQFSGNLDITIFGVINPNRINNNPTGLFTYGILGSDGYTLIAGTTSITGIIPQLAPEDIKLIQIQSTTPSARYSSDYTFDFSPYQSVISTVFGGQLIVDFPLDFIIDSQSGKCDTTPAFSFFSSCQLDYFRFFLVTNNYDWNPAVQGPLEIKVYGVRSPDLAGETQNFIIYNYDKVNKIVLGRTYSNLNRASLVFQYDGLQIDVNDELAYNLEVGSYSDPILLNITLPTSFPLTLSPNVLDSRILIEPNPVQLQIGDTQAFFRIAAPRDILLKAFYITWSKTGDSLVATYAPLRKTKLNMVKGTLKRVFNIEPMEYIPRNGSTYPLYITTSNPPYQEVVILLSFYPNLFLQRMKIDSTELKLLNLTSYVQVYTTSGLPSFDTISQANLSTNSLYVKKLMNSVSYTVNTSINFTASNLSIYFGLSGFDAQSYILNNTVSFIQIRGQEYRQPKILDNSILNITSSSASFRIFGDIKGFIYYAVADQHMPSPIFQQIHFPNQSDAILKYSNPLYGVDYIRSGSLDINFTISNLLDNHDYEIFIFIMNMNRVFNPGFTKIYFQTLRSQKIATFTLKLSQSNLDPEVKLDFMAKMALMIFIPKQRIIEYTTQCTQTIVNFSPDPTQLYFNILILPDPTNMIELRSPLNLAETLNSRRLEIQNFITRLDPDPFVLIQELADQVPNFVMSPTMMQSTISSLAIEFTVSNCGEAYLTIIERQNSSYSTLVNETDFASEFPSQQFSSTYQIRSGLDIMNQPVNRTKMQVINIMTPLNFNFTNLKSRTVYDVYIGLENNFLTDPLLFDNQSVARFSAKTLKNIIPLNIYSMNYAHIKTVVFFVVGLFYIL